jgi:alpha-amylase
VQLHAPPAHCAGFQAILPCLCTLSYVLQKLCDWLNASNKTCTAFDFPTKGILQEAIKKNELWRLKDSKGKPPGLMGW